VLGHPAAVVSVDQDHRETVVSRWNVRHVRASSVHAAVSTSTTAATDTPSTRGNVVTSESVNLHRSVIVAVTAAVSVIPMSAAVVSCQTAAVERRPTLDAMSLSVTVDLTGRLASTPPAAVVVIRSPAC